MNNLKYRKLVFKKLKLKKDEKLLKPPRIK